MKKYTAYTLIFALALFSFIKTGPTAFADADGSNLDASTSSSLPINSGDTANEGTLPTNVPSNTDESGSSTPTNVGTDGDTASSSIPSNSTDNTNEGSSSIPTNVPTDSDTGSSSIPTNIPSNFDSGSSSIPVGLGSNDDETATTSTTTILTGTTTATTTTTTSTTGSNNTATGGGGSSLSEFSSGGGGAGGIGDAEAATTSSSTALTGTLACPFMTGYVLPGRSENAAQNINTPSEISKLQVFLNTYEGDNAVTVTGVIDQPTISGILSFQEKYLSQVMGPWDATTPSGNAYITTQHQINALVCGPQPLLTSAQQAIINTYLSTLAASSTNSIGSTSTVASSTNSLVSSTTSGTTTGSTGNNSLLTGNVVSSGASNFFGGLFTKIVNFFRGK